MLKSIIAIYEHGLATVSAGTTEKKITWAGIKVALAGVLQKVREGKFQDPKQSDASIKAYFDSLTKEIETSFAALSDA